MSVQGMLFARDEISQPPPPKVGAGIHPDCKNLAFLYTATETGTNSGIRFMLTVEEAKTWCNWEGSKGRKTHGDRFTISYYGATQGGRSLDRPIGTITTRDRHALIDGDRMRMLTVEETRRIMGFPDTYHLPASHKDAMTGLGNAVVPPVATAFISALRAQA